jgi:lysophospholipase L1-like esterase
MLRKLSLSLASLLIALLCAELVLRLAGAAPEVGVVRQGRFQLSANPRIGYEPVPELHYEGEDLSFYDYQGTGNRLGYRDRDHAEEKPPDVFRIVVLGDSIGAGLRVARFEDTFPAILERLLRERGQNAEVINFSVSGYNTRQEVETLAERGLRYQPDLVLLAYSMNDREQVDGAILERLLEQRRAGTTVDPNRSAPVLVRSALWRFLRYRAFPPPRRQLDEELRRYRELLSGDTVAASFADLAELSRREGVPVLVALFPRLPRWHSLPGPTQEHRAIAELSRRHGFQYLDLLGAFRACRTGSKAPLAFDTLHPTPRGHACAARALAGAVMAMMANRDRPATGRPTP